MCARCVSVCAVWLMDICECKECEHGICMLSLSHFAFLVSCNYKFMLAVSELLGTDARHALDDGRHTTAPPKRNNVMRVNAE